MCLSQGIVYLFIYLLLLFPCLSYLLRKKHTYTKHIVYIELIDHFITKNEKITSAACSSPTGAQLTTEKDDRFFIFPIFLINPKQIG
jgi:hypothetical protein